MINPIVWFEIYVQDVPRARKFYEGVFQCKLQQMAGPDIEMWGFPSDMGRHGASGTIIKTEGVPSGGNSTLVYFGCDDCAVEESRAERFGGRVERIKMSIGQYGFVSILRDPDNNRIGLHSRK